MLKRSDYKDALSQRSPMVTSRVNNYERRDRDDETNDRILDLIKSTKYREIIGSLLHSADESRPDIAYAVNVLSRHQLNGKLSIDY